MWHCWLHCNQTPIGRFEECQQGSGKCLKGFMCLLPKPELLQLKHRILKWMLSVEHVKNASTEIFWQMPATFHKPHYFTDQRFFKIPTARKSKRQNWQKLSLFLLRVKLTCCFLNLSVVNQGLLYFEWNHHQYYYQYQYSYINTYKN